MVVMVKIMVVVTRDDTNSCNGNVGEIRLLVMAMMMMLVVKMAMAISK